MLLLNTQLHKNASPCYLHPWSSYLTRRAWERWCGVWEVGSWWKSQLQSRCRPEGRGARGAGQPAHRLALPEPRAPWVHRDIAWEDPGSWAWGTKAYREKSISLVRSALFQPAAVGNRTVGAGERRAGVQGLLHCAGQPAWAVFLQNCCPQVCRIGLGLLLWDRTKPSNSFLLLNQLLVGVCVFFLSVKCRLLFSLC